MEYQLPKEFATKWVAALRSGEYKQTTNFLKNPKEDSYCCLGVCAIINGFTDKKLLEANGELGEIGQYLDEDHDEFEYALLEFGIPMELIIGGLPNDLINMNDTVRMPFPEIADWIESNVEFI